MTEKKVVKMSVAEALKEIKLCKVKIERNCRDIARFSSRVAELPPIIEGQADYVKKLKQATEDRFKRIIDIQTKLQISNLETKAVVAGREYTINQLLLLKQGSTQNGLKDLKESFLASFNESAAEEQKQTYLRYATKDAEGERKPPTVVHHYKEKEMREERDNFIEFLLKVDAAIDASNHSTFIEL